jgi:hypothetical protein
MAMTHIDHDGHTLEISTEMIEVTSMGPEPNPGWKFTDGQGHEHDAQQAEEGHVLYPTLRLESGPASWCPDCRDDHTDSWFVCRQCEEKIIPGVVYPSGPRFVRGLTSYEIDGEPVDPATARAFVTAWQRSIDDANNDAVAALIDLRMEGNGHA